MSRLDNPDSYTDYIQLIPLRAGAEDQQGNEDVGIRAKAARTLRQRAAFLFIVVLPVFLAIVYFGFIAADRYVAEAHFVVRSPSRAAADQLSSLIQSTGVTRATDDANAVHQYIESRDAVHLLATTVNLRQLLSRPEADFFWRFPSLFRSDSDEKLYDSYLSFVTIDSDPATGISTLNVQAFRPEDAVTIANALLEGSEKLINRLNGRARHDTVALATVEVELAKQHAYQAREKLTEFRTKVGLVDPSQSSAKLLETIGKLSFDVSNANAELTEALRGSPQSPQVATLRNRINALESQIAAEKVRIGGTSEALAPMIADYERLVLEREFADRAFASALTTLEVARMEAQRQQLYLERIVEPRLADDARYPRRLLMIFAVLGVSVAVYMIVVRLLANVRAHRPL